MADNQDEIPLFPVASWQIGPVPRYDIVTFRPNFLTHLSQKPEEAETGNYYALTAPQVRHLIQDLQSALQKLESAGPQVPPGTQH